MTKPPGLDEIDRAQRLSEGEWRALRERLGRVTADARTIDDIRDEGVFLGYQKRLLEATAINRVTVVEKSRRTGATWALASDAVLTSAMTRADGGMDTLYIGYNLDMAKEFIDTCGDWARVFHAITVDVKEFIFKGKDEKGADRDIQAFRIHFASGFEIIALTSNPRSLRGRQGYVIIDEAAFHDDFKGLLKAAVALLVWGGKICIISTHNGEDNAYNEVVKDIRAGRKNFALIRFDFDEALLDGLYERVCLRTGKVWSAEAEARWRAGIIADYGDDAEEELYCVPSQGSGIFLSGSLIEAVQDASIPVFRYEADDNFVHKKDDIRRADLLAWLTENIEPVVKTLDPSRRHVMGADFGRVHDLTVFWPLVIERTMIRRTPFVVELRNVPFKEQELVGKWLGEAMPNFAGLAPDGTGLGAATSEAFLQHFGSHVVTVVHLSQSWYREEMPKFKRAFEDREILIPKDDDVFSDLRLLKVVKGIAQLPTGQRTLEAAKKGKRRHGDAAIAAALAYFASAFEFSAYDYDGASNYHTGFEDNEDDLDSARNIEGFRHGGHAW